MALGRVGWAGHQLGAGQLDKGAVGHGPGEY